MHVPCVDIVVEFVTVMVRVIRILKYSSSGDVSYFPIAIISYGSCLRNWFVS